MNPLLTKALRAATSARKLLDDEDYDGACDRAYYAMFNATRALLEADGALDPRQFRTHGAVLRLFSEVFVLSGRASRDLGRGLNVVLGLRATADYARESVTAEDAEGAINTMTAMLEFTTDFLQQDRQRES